MEWHTKSPKETQALARTIVSQFPNVHVICLEGPLGSGKTCFVQGLGESLRIEPRNIKSPTFIGLMEHAGSPTLLHGDFYRHDATLPLDLDWWNELLNRKNSLLVVEWAERIAPHLPKERLDIHFEVLNEYERKITLHSRP